MRASEAWMLLGILPADNAHAHCPDTGAGPMFIMALADNLEEGRPEKLS